MNKVKKAVNPKRNKKQETSPVPEIPVVSIDPEQQAADTNSNINGDGSSVNTPHTPATQNLNTPVAPKKEYEYIISGKQLLDLNITVMPVLLDPLLPKTGVAALAGSSDTGKSSILRQLAVEIVTGEPNSLGFPLNSTHKKAIYVSTEDDKFSMAFLLQKQMVSDEKKALYDNLAFIFNTENLLPNLERVLKKHKVDAIFIDTITDIYEGDLNQTNKIRSFINKFSNLAEKYKCLIVFLHHTGKRTESLPPSKDNLLGSQGFEAKMRMVIELRRDFENPSLRHLCIVKANYLPEEYKRKSFVFEFDDNMRFTNLNRRVPFEQLARKDTDYAERSAIKEKAIAYYTEGLTVREVTDKLQEEGYKISKSAVGNWIKGQKQVFIIGYGYESDEPDLNYCGEDPEGY